MSMLWTRCAAWCLKWRHSTSYSRVTSKELTTELQIGTTQQPIPTAMVIDSSQSMKTTADDTYWFDKSVICQLEQGSKGADTSARRVLFEAASELDRRAQTAVARVSELEIKTATIADGIQMLTNQMAALDDQMIEHDSGVRNEMTRLRIRRSAAAHELKEVQTRVKNMIALKVKLRLEAERARDTAVHAKAAEALKNAVQAVQPMLSEQGDLHIDTLMHDMTALSEAQEQVDEVAAVLAGDEGEDIHEEINLADEIDKAFIVANLPLPVITEHDTTAHTNPRERPAMQAAH